MWAEALPYYSQPYDSALKLCRFLRASNYLLLKNADQDLWLHTVSYENHGQIFIEDLLDMYEKHLDKAIHEIAMITEIYLKVNNTNG